MAKKYLIKLNDMAINHIMHEDIEFFKMERDDMSLDEQTKKMIDDFVDGFKSTKLALMSFLKKYSKPEVALDEEFFKTFNELVGILGERIKYEEENLYSKLKD